MRMPGYDASTDAVLYAADARDYADRRMMMDTLRADCFQWSLLTEHPTLTIIQGPGRTEGTYRCETMTEVARKFLRVVSTL